MAKYLKKFKNHSEYESYIGGDPILPNVSLCENEDEIHLNDDTIVSVTSVTVDTFTYNPSEVYASGGTASPSITYTINFSDGSTKYTGGTLSYTKVSGDADLNDSTGVLIWGENTSTGNRSTEVTVTVSCGGKSDSKNAINEQSGKEEYDSQVGEIAYWDGSRIDYIPHSKWESSLGTPLAVCVIPKTHYGTARFMSIKGVNTDGTESNNDVKMEWGPTGDTSLTNYDKLPTWDNTIGGIVGVEVYGYISSNRSDFTGATNVIDTKTKYQASSPYIPSPYAADGSLNTNYNVGALSDLDGKSNTVVLAKLGSDYKAANACYKYKTSGTSAGDWYLPAAGELAYIMPRFEVINAALNKCGGVPIDTNRIYWSSTESNIDDVYRIITDDGIISCYTKFYLYYVRPFINLS